MENALRDAIREAFVASPQSIYQLGQDSSHSRLKVAGTKSDHRHVTFLLEPPQFGENEIHQAVNDHDPGADDGIKVECYLAQSQASE